MNKLEWLDTWVRLRDRFPSWQPSKTEAEDWCIGLRVYSVEMVEEVGQWVRQRYSSENPKMPWFVKECEKRKTDMKREIDYKTSEGNVDVEEYESRKEMIMTRLEKSSIDDLRTACIAVLKKYGHLISKPESAKPSEWKPTLRSLVHIELFGGE